MLRISGCGTGYSKNVGFLSDYIRKRVNLELQYVSRIKKLYIMDHLTKRRSNLLHYKIKNNTLKLKRFFLKNTTIPPSWMDLNKVRMFVVILVIFLTVLLRMFMILKRVLQNSLLNLNLLSPLIKDPTLNTEAFTLSFGVENSLRPPIFESIQPY